MNHKILKGIALILFGILLCVGGVEMNNTILYSVIDFDLPFSLAGVICGIVGLVMVFRKNRSDVDK